MFVVGTGGVALGLAIGPAIQIIFVPIGEQGWRLFENFQLSMYTSPAIFACLVNLTAIFTMLFIFEEKYAGLVNDKVKKNEEKTYIPPIDTLAILAIYTARLMQMFIFSASHSLKFVYLLVDLECGDAGHSICNDHVNHPNFYNHSNCFSFSFTKSETVSYVSISHVAVSGLELAMYVTFIVFKLDRL